jgi:hypothetical protein
MGILSKFTDIETKPKRREASVWDCDLDSDDGKLLESEAHCMEGGFELNKKPRNTGKWWLPKELRIQERRKVQKLFNGWTARIGKTDHRTGEVFTGGHYLETLRKHEASWR